LLSERQELQPEQKRLQQQALAQVSRRKRSKQEPTGQQQEQNVSF